MGKIPGRLTDERRLVAKIDKEKHGFPRPALWKYRWAGNRQRDFRPGKGRGPQQGRSYIALLETRMKRKDIVSIGHPFFQDLLVEMERPILEAG